MTYVQYWFCVIIGPSSITTTYSASVFYSNKIGVLLASIEFDD